MAGTGNAHLRDGNTLLRVDGLVVEYSGAARTKPVQAVSGLSFDIAEGEVLGLVGESGCGKSTTGRAALHLQKSQRGTVSFHGRDVASLSGNERRLIRRQLQIIFQDPRSSLNPRRSVNDSLEEPLRIWGTHRPSERQKLITNALHAVGLEPYVLSRRPSELSGGQCQRLCIARCLLLRPKLIVCDEPVASLDVSVQAQILNLLHDLRAEYGLALLFISHDLAVVKNISDRVAVMYLGKLCEVAPSDTLYSKPAHPYTDLLLRSIPVPDSEIGSRPPVLVGDRPSPRDPPSGCRFRTSCPRAEEICSQVEPKVRKVAPDRFVACHFPLVGD